MIIDIHTHTDTLGTEDPNVKLVYNLPEKLILENKLKQKDNVYFSCGIHPWWIKNELLTFDLLATFAKNDNKIVAIGEAGLDALIDTPIDVQKDIFVKQIKLASDLHLPMIIHCVKAWDLLLQLYKEYQPTIPWIIHGFRGGKEQAEQLMKFGFYFSLGEYYNVEALKAIYPNTLLIETDESTASIFHIYSRIAQDLKVEQHVLQQTVQQNVSKLFNFF